MKPIFEAKESWEEFTQNESRERPNEEVVESTSRRRLKHHHHKHHHTKETQRQELLHELYRDPGIHNGRVHGMMIDAGSTGSRLHIYEWQPRVLRSRLDVEQVAAGNKLSYPDTNTRWTDRLQPGLATFAEIADEDELVERVAAYFEPLLDFARTVLHEKQVDWATYPIYLRATAGMRTLEREQRARVIQAVRTVFSNSTLMPFSFQNDEQARVISGEEEAVFDWTAVNFLLGNLVSQTEGTGAVLPPVLGTHGALDLGGASTQISFYEPDEDIMSNLFKLQIGQSKHWNIYAHSFLFYGMNEAMNRFNARLFSEGIASNTNSTHIVNPCLPVGALVTAHSWIDTQSGMEQWMHNEMNFTMTNDAHDVDSCFTRVQDLLHIAQNSWCNFAHRGDCSLAGVYQPQLPQYSQFVAFSNYKRVWDILKLPESSSVGQLGATARSYCTHPPPEDDPTNCFRAAYAYKLLSQGYGFHADQQISAVRVVAGQHVGWALGAMLYEINTLPWTYQQTSGDQHLMAQVLSIGAAFLVALWAVLYQRERRLRRRYDPIKNVDLSRI